MTNLSQEQEALKAGIQKSAVIWGVILGAAAAGIAYWLLSGQSSGMRIGLAVAIGAATLVGIAMWRIKANSASAACGKCNAAFSITRTDRAEETKSSANKETRDAQPDYSTKVITWVEDTVAVTDTYTCAKCNDATTKQYTKTVKRDEVETIEPAPEKGKADEKPAEEESEGWFSEPAKSADGGMKSSDGGLQPSPVDGVATSSKGKCGGKSRSSKK